LDTAASGLLRRCGSTLRSLDISKFGPLEYGLRAGMEAAIIEHCAHLTSITMNNRLLDRDWLLKYAQCTNSRLLHISMWMVGGDGRAYACSRAVAHTRLWRPGRRIAC
jgi:hypothetical protein